MGDADYMYAFEKIIMPICREYNPDFVLVSAGFDAALGDELGECNVTPSGFAEMTRQLNTLADGKMALALEGGYHAIHINSKRYCIPALQDCITACMRVLVGEGDTVPLPDITNGPHDEAIEICDEVIGNLKAFWKCFESHVPTITQNSSEEESASSTGSSGGSSDPIVLTDGNGDESRKKKKTDDGDEVLSEVNANEMRMVVRTRDLGLVAISTPRSECSVTHTNNFQTVERPCFVFLHDMYISIVFILDLQV
jgi:hypothetical protein